MCYPMNLYLRILRDKGDTPINMDKLQYKPLERIEKNEIQEILKSGTEKQLALLPLRVGEYCSNWKEAQDVCLQLMSNENAIVRANAALGLAYIARKHRRLDKRLVKPYLIRELRENTEYRWRIVDSIEDINNFLGWHIADKH